MDLGATLLKSLVKFTKVEGEQGKPIKPIIYAFESISAEIRGRISAVGPKIPEMTAQAGRDGVCCARGMGRAVSTDSDASRLRPWAGLAIRLMTS